MSTIEEARDRGSHVVISTDELVNKTGYASRPGTVARCSCGWRSAWMTRDGSAEADGHGHLRAVDPEYRARDDERHAAWKAENEERKAKAEDARIARPAPAPPARRRERCHDCSCHINPPCGGCENCKHADYPECPNDCQDCEEHDD